LVTTDYVKTGQSLRNFKAVGLKYKKNKLDGCIVWNAHKYSTRLEVLAYLYVSSNTMSSALKPTSVPSGILIHSAIWPQ